MSMGWYFYTFQQDLLTKLLGHATAAQKKKLIATITDPDEFGELEQNQLEIRSTRAKQILEDGLDYTGTKELQAAELDEITKMIFHRMGLAKEIKAKPISVEPMTVQVAAEIARVAKLHLPQSIIPIFDHGRRFGQTEPTHCGYVVLTQSEIARLHNNVTHLLSDRSITWKHPDFLPAIKIEFLSPLTKAMADKKLALYANCT